MNDKSNFMVPSMPPLPEPLADTLSRPLPGMGKRERTRAQLIASAIQVFASRGVAATTVQEIANVAGMTTGTVYNHFATKEDMVQQVAIWLAQTLCQRITDSQQGIKEGAERMAIGNRRYIWLAEQSPAWALMMLDIAVAAPHLADIVNEFVLADLRLGVAQKSFQIPSETAALNMVNGTIMQAMQSVALGHAPPDHASEVSAMVLCGLGIPFEIANEISRRPLPSLGPRDTPLKA